MPVLRRKLPGTERTFRLPGGVLIPCLALAMCFYFLSQATGKQLSLGRVGPRGRARSSTLHDAGPRRRPRTARWSKNHEETLGAGRRVSWGRPCEPLREDGPAPTPKPRHRAQGGADLRRPLGLRRSRAEWSWWRARRSWPSAPTFRSPPGATVIDLGDATLLPGFIDSHTHVTGEGGDNYIAGLLRGSAPAGHGAGLLAARCMPGRCSTPGSRRFATSAARRTWTSACATRSTTGSAGPAHAGRALRPRRDRRALRQHRLSARHLWGGARGRAGHRPWRRRGPPGGAARRQVRRRRDQDVRVRRRAVARRRRRRAAAHRRGADGDHRRGASAQAQDRGALPRRSRGAVGREGGRSTRSSTVRS